MNVHEISDRYKIPLGKLKRLAKDGLLVVTAGDDRPAKMRAYLSSNRALSVPQLIALARDDGRLMAKLGTYQHKAESQLAELGNPGADAVETQDSANWIYGASIADPGTMPRVVEWLKRTIPAGPPVTYHYVGARLLWNCPENRFAASYQSLPRAIINLRRHPDLAGWHNDASPIKFHRPALDL